MSDRFVLPAPGSSTPVRFPPIGRERLANGLDVWTIVQPTIPTFTAMLVLRRGTADDPAGLPGLASLTSDLLDEGAAGRDAIAFGDALARMGAELDIEVGPDATTLSLRALSRTLQPGLGLLADAVIRPHLNEADFERVRELRVSRLRQLSRSASTVADRAFMTAVFGDHPYGHGALGTSQALNAMTVDHARGFWSRMYGPGLATLIVAGDVSRDDVSAAVGAFREWTSASSPQRVSPAPAVVDEQRVLFAERPAAPQAELRIGHVGPPRHVDRYHALVTLNAVLGGQFTSRINQRLRQEKGFTYGARTSFEFRKYSGVFSCDTSVQANATAEAVQDVLDELDRIRRAGEVDAEELQRAKASLTRGYVRHFETAGQLARGASQLAIYDLDDETFDRFVDRVDAVTADDVRQAALDALRPEAAAVVVVGDPDVCVPAMETLGGPIARVRPEF